MVQPMKPSGKSNTRVKAIARPKVKAKMPRNRDVFDDRPTLEEYDKQRAISRIIVWSEALEDQIVGLVSEGYTMREIAKLRDYPPLNSMLRRMSESERFMDGLVRAREVAVYALADQIISIADEATPDDVQVAKLRVEVRQWVMGRFNRRQFGDKLDVDGMLGGAAGRLTISWQGEDKPANPMAAKVLDVKVGKSPSSHDGRRDGNDAIDVTPSNVDQHASQHDAQSTDERRST